MIFLAARPGDLSLAHPFPPPLGSRPIGIDRWWLAVTLDPISQTFRLLVGEAPHRLEYTAFRGGERYRWVCPRRVANDGFPQPLRCALCICQSLNEFDIINAKETAEFERHVGRWLRKLQLPLADIAGGDTQCFREGTLAEFVLSSQRLDQVGEVFEVAYVHDSLYKH